MEISHEPSPSVLISINDARRTRAVPGKGLDIHFHASYLL